MSGIAPELSSAFIATARRYHLGAATAEDDAILQDATFHALAGGWNNGVYAFQQLGVPYCLKCHKVDGRQRAEREWQMLGVLAAQGYRAAPQPLWYDPDPRAPMIVMEFVPGVGLGGQRLDRMQCTALTGALQELYAITPAVVHDSIAPAAGSVSRILPRVRAAVETIAASPSDGETREAARLWWAWLRGPDPALLCEQAAAILSRGDPNLTNWLWDGARIRTVDFEYGGWSDRAFDLADLVEHPQSRGTPEDVWATFVAQFGLSSAEERRYAAARRLFAIFFLMKFWPPGEQPADDRFRSQLARVQALLAGEAYGCGL